MSTTEETTEVAASIVGHVRAIIVDPVTGKDDVLVITAATSAATIGEQLADPEFSMRILRQAFSGVVKHVYGWRIGRPTPYQQLPPHRCKALTVCRYVSGPKVGAFARIAFDLTVRDLEMVYYNVDDTKEFITQTAAAQGMELLEFTGFQFDNS